MTSSNTDSVAIVFADICDSTRLYEALGDDRAFQRVAQRLEKITTIIERSEGRVVKTMGDGVMAVFGDPSRAFLAAMLAHGITGSEEDEELTIRVGCHTGPVIERDGDVFGDAVNVASRIQGLAQPGETLVSKDARGLLSGDQRAQTRLVHKLAVKGKQEPVSVYRIVADIADLTLDTPFPSRADGQEVHLLLGFGTQRYRLEPGCPKFVMGRDDSCDIVVTNSQSVSRQHATIEYCQGRYLLHDQSSNGTYVGRGADELVALRRESLQLLDHGVISLGERPGIDGSNQIMFCREVERCD